MWDDHKLEVEFQLMRIREEEISLAEEEDRADLRKVDPTALRKTPRSRTADHKKPADRSGREAG